MKTPEDLTVSSEPSSCKQDMNMDNIVPGIVISADSRKVRVQVNRKSACGGCQAADICHSLTNNLMDFDLPLPGFAVHKGDRVNISLAASSLLKATGLAFMLPLFFIVLVLSITTALGMGVAIQASGILISLIISLFIVRWLGNRLERPRITGIIHEE
ncbi:MAG: SoxR reducing system RseC family protein [Thermodesulfobacteriota bacterium]|nr:SoxR reducing system RseC family protein [Thermodesulfobacteriota bacterium]